MPITKGAGNPDWTRDEALLALDLLYQHGKPLGLHRQEVIELSDLLQQATLHPLEKRMPSFRNPDGVALKMQNLFAAIETGRGLSAANIDRAVVAEFPKHKHNELRVVASQIRAAFARGEAVGMDEEEEAFVEGHILTARHRSRDRNLRKRLLRATTDESLRCAVCTFTPPMLDRATRESFFEAHHIRPLAETNGPVTNRVRDVVLMCAGCHRFIHQLMRSRRRWISIDEARQTFCAAKTEARPDVQPL